MPDELAQQLAKWRQDFETQQGAAFRHFYCPILLQDENVEIVRGHIVNEKLEVCRAWVPQRKDVDNFFGSIAEADFVAVVEDRGKDAVEVLVDPRLRRRYRPRLEIEGQPIGYYMAARIGDA